MTQIKEFLRRGLFTVIVLCSAAACSNNDENEDTNYTLDSIQWAMLNDDKVEETVINIMPEIYENASSSTISVTIDPAMDYKQLSQFYYDDPKFFQPLNQTPNEVNVLTGELVFNDFRYVSEGPVVPFTLEEYAYPPDNHIDHRKVLIIQKFYNDKFGLQVSAMEFRTFGEGRLHFRRGISGIELE